MQRSIRCCRCCVRAAVICALLVCEQWLTSGKTIQTEDVNCEGRACDILSCFHDDCLARASTWSTFLENRPACFRPYRIWWSRKPSPFAVTLVTQLSADRLVQVRAQCATWAGPLAAALYLPIITNDTNSLSRAQQRKINSAVAAVDELFMQSEHPHNKRLACQLRLMLVYEVVADDQVAMLYPVNSMRNYARLMADTQLIANIDVDMLPSVSVSSALQDAAKAKLYQQGARTNHVYVIPAFETRCGGPSFADNIATLPKSQLDTHIQADCLGQMRGKVADACHGPTNYARWFVDDEPYDIQYGTHFEPWFISQRMTTRWFDGQYRGYGKNKIVQALYSNYTGTRFRVFTDGFLVHRYHTDSKARKQFLRQKFSRKGFLKLKGTVYEHVESLWNATLAEIAAGMYKPRVDPGFLACVAKLEWWKPPPPL